MAAGTGFMIRAPSTQAGLRATLPCWKEPSLKNNLSLYAGSWQDLYSSLKLVGLRHQEERYSYNNLYIRHRVYVRTVYYLLSVKMRVEIQQEILRVKS